LPDHRPVRASSRALGSFVRVYREAGVPLATLAHAARALPGIDAVLTRAEASERYELPTSARPIWW